MAMAGAYGMSRGGSPLAESDQELEPIRFQTEGAPFPLLRQCAELRERVRASSKSELPVDSDEGHCEDDPAHRRPRTTPIPGR